jgi:uncharacterized damage-inducible protein DinB
MGVSMEHVVAQETEMIADEVGRALDGDAWHGPSISEALVSVDSETAAGRPIPGAHSIWEIVLHMTAWANEVERRLRERANPLPDEDDWPPVRDADSSSWESARGALRDAHARLRQTIRDFSPVRLGEPVRFGADEHDEGSFYVMLHGLAQHDAYHTGQIAMLKRAVGG